MIAVQETSQKHASIWPIFLSGGLLFVLTFIWYLIDGGLIETGGDAVGRWRDLTGIIFRGEYPNPDHHSLRWGINLPILIFLKVAGSDHPILYHFVMPTFGAATAVTIYLIVRRGEFRLGTEFAYCALTMAFVVIAPSERAFSQLLPSGAGTFYACAALLAMKHAVSRPGKWPSSSLFLAGVLCLFAYGSKETMVWFVLPLSFCVLILYLREKNTKNLISFFSPLFLGVLLETLVVKLLTGFNFGRALYVTSGGGSHGVWLERGISQWGMGFETFTEYFFGSPMRYAEALGYYSVLIYSAVLFILLTSVFGRNRREGDKFLDLLGWTILGFFCLQSYFVVSVYPFVYPEKFIHARYQYPLLALSTVYWLYQSCRFSEFRKIESKYLATLFGVGSLAIFGISFIFFTNNILSRHNNLGLVVTLLHNKVLTEWIDHGGNFGYRAEIVESADQVDVDESLKRSPNQKVVSYYVRAIYRRDYCELVDTFVYRNDTTLFGLCEEWKENESVLFYFATSLEFLRPRGLIYLGKYSDIGN